MIVFIQLYACVFQFTSILISLLFFRQMCDLPLCVCRSVVQTPYLILNHIYMIVEQANITCLTMNTVFLREQSI